MQLTTETTRRHQGRAGNQALALGEVAITVQQQDRDRAQERAATLERGTGIRTQPATVGQTREGAGDPRFLQLDAEKA